MKQIINGGIQLNTVGGGHQNAQEFDTQIKTSARI